MASERKGRSSAKGIERRKAAPDFSGRMLSFIKNTAGYAREGGKYDEEVVERVVDVASRAVEDGTFFALNPQFLVTATV